MTQFGMWVLHKVFCLQQWERLLTCRPCSVWKTHTLPPSHSQEKSAYITYWYVSSEVDLWGFCGTWCCVSMWAREKQRTGDGSASWMSSVAALTCDYSCVDTTLTELHSVGHLLPVHQRWHTAAPAAFVMMSQIKGRQEVHDKQMSHWHLKDLNVQVSLKVTRHLGQDVPWIAIMNVFTSEGGMKCDIQECNGGKMKMHVGAVYPHLHFFN